jgi:divinyl chlorophyllide a 8-vinyl-reductase
MKHRVLAPRMRIFMLGSTGTIGRATLQALVKRGHDVVAFVRPASASAALNTKSNEEGWTLRTGDIANLESVRSEGLCGEKFDILVSCVASRDGSAQDAWRIDYQANLNALTVLNAAGAGQVILLSAICVQKPLLAFQHAKLAFEKAVIESGMTYSIVRPTAFFKSLSGQVERVKRGKAFLVFGDGELTACKPISDDDLAEYLADCIDQEKLHNRILPIGGPGAAITPKRQGEMLFSLLEREPRFKHVPLWLLDGIIFALTSAGRIFPAAAKKAELARIGRYYATESMLVWDDISGAYDADATPSAGSQELEGHYRRLIAGELRADLGEHSVF